MLELLELLRGSNELQDANTTSFITHTHKFVTAFASVISQSAPHLYLSALPFAPESCKLSKRYLPEFPRLLRMKTGKLMTWPAIQNVLLGHTDWVWSVAFSSDGKRIVSGSRDCTIRVWNADSGEVISGPFEGHTEWVSSVAFSPDGKHIVSGSGDDTIYVWDADSGEVISGPLKSHTSMVSSVAFSPDGKRIVSGSYDHTIRVWNADSGEVISGPLEGHTDWVSSVAFSPDGKRIVSGSEERTIRMWNADSGKIISGPSEGHSFSGSSPTTLRLLDSETPSVGLCPFVGQDDGQFVILIGLTWSNMLISFEQLHGLGLGMTHG